MTSPRWTWLAGAVLLVALSYWVGKRQGARSDAGAPASTSAASSARQARPGAIERAGAANASAALDGEELRAVVREELARSAAERDGAAAAAASEAADSADSADSARLANPARAERMAQAVTAATAAIETGIVDGIWDDRDRDALRAELPYLGERETHAVLSPLFQAVNAQRVKLDGPPI
jgi:hypothetical protein